MRSKREYVMFTESDLNYECSEINKSKDTELLKFAQVIENYNLKHINCNELVDCSEDQIEYCRVLKVHENSKILKFGLDKGKIEESSYLCLIYFIISAILIFGYLFYLMYKFIKSKMYVKNDIKENSIELEPLNK
ncbi:hypothetical protein H312_01527 [Anncaliia algerae PRA339]|uniref:Uncharacterized protein n=1 Tax=Anncaliia algerae PRA339 TaxID=1288291 RepID=A0A059F283_9MICR|nr:hypothetical protein H312_01527 [Anncaliia algerae PRA339]